MADKRKPSPEEPSSQKEISEIAGDLEDEIPSTDGNVTDQAETSSSEIGAEVTGVAEGSAETGVEASPTVEELQAELEGLRSQAEDYLDGWQRARAEFQNYKKRIDRELEDAKAHISGDILARYLPILDDLDRALKDRPTDDDAAAWAEGIELIYRKLQAILESEGIEPIPAEGQTFDPNLHEALSHEESDEFESGKVIDVIQRGYKLGDRVLRPALVRVSK